MRALDDIVRFILGAVAQLGERGLCKPEVVGSIPISSTVRSLWVGPLSRTSESDSDDQAPTRTGCNR
jgi:hypothetical protein